MRTMKNVSLVGLGLGLSMLASACVLDDDAGDGDDPDLSSTEQALASFIHGGFSSTTSLEGWDTGLDPNVWTCVLAGVTGNLGEGGAWQASLRSSAYVALNAQGRWEVYAHGGAYTNLLNQRVWSNNVVGATASCVPYPRVHQVNPRWKSGDYPVWMGAAPNRHCFLAAVHTGDQVFTHNGDYVRVKKYTTTDATHPQPGWYVESNLARQPYTGLQSIVEATCIDFPTVTNAWNPGTVGQGTTTLTSGNGIKMCGLQALEGSFEVDNVNDGVRINAPVGLWGQWSVTVSTGDKSARVQCIE